MGDSRSPSSESSMYIRARRLNCRHRRLYYLLIRQLFLLFCVSVCWGLLVLRLNHAPSCTALPACCCSGSPPNSSRLSARLGTSLDDVVVATDVQAVAGTGAEFAVLVPGYVVAGPCASLSRRPSMALESLAKSLEAQSSLEPTPVPRARKRLENPSRGL